MLDDYEEDDECEIQTENFFGEIFVFFLPPNKTECFLHLLLTNRIFLTGISATDFCADQLHGWGLAAKWAQLLITTNCCLTDMAKI